VKSIGDTRGAPWMKRYPTTMPSTTRFVLTFREVERTMGVIAEELARARGGVEALRRAGSLALGTRLGRRQADLLQELLELDGRLPDGLESGLLPRVQVEDHPVGALQAGYPPGPGVQRNEALLGQLGQRGRVGRRDLLLAAPALQGDLHQPDPRGELVRDPLLVRPVPLDPVREALEGEGPPLGVAKQVVGRVAV